MLLDFHQRFWKISAGENAQFLNIFTQYGFIALGQFNEGDLLQYSDKKHLENVLKILTNANKSKTANYCWQFARELDIDNYIIVYDDSSILLIGQVLSTYYYQPDDIGKTKYTNGLPHRRNINWISSNRIHDRHLLILSQPQDAFYELNNAQKQVVFPIIRQIQ